MTEFALHPSFKQESAETSLPNGLNVAFPQELDHLPPMTVPCYTADQLTISFAEMPNGRKFAIIAMRFGPTGLVVDYTNKEQIDAVIAGLTQARDLL